MNNTSISGLEQDFKLVFQIAWGPGGTAVERILATFITGSVAINILTNIITFVGILRPPDLRKSKEHLLMAYMSLFDFMDACWYFCMVGLDYGIQSRIECFLTLRHALWFIFGGTGSTAMLVMISIDRIFCIGIPVWYWKQDYRYGHKCALSVFIFTAIVACYLAYIPITRPDDPVPYCFTSHTFMEGFDHESVLRRILLGISIFLYGVVLVMHKMHGKLQVAKLANTGSKKMTQSIWERHQKLQKKMTVTLGISAMITLMFHILPLSIWHWLRAVYPTLQQFGYILFALINWSSVANLFIFSLRHEEIQAAIVSLLKCQPPKSKVEPFLGSSMRDGPSRSRTRISPMDELPRTPRTQIKVPRLEVSQTYY